MELKQALSTLGFKPKDGAIDIYSKKYQQHNYSIEIDFSKERICYGDLIGADCKTTQNFSQAENWVVLECVNRLLEKGYKPQNIILEKTWAAGHGTSGRLDICVTRDDGSEYLLIECKTFGKEFDKAVAKLNKDGGQLFTYFKFSNKADVIMLYASELQDEEFVYKNEIIKIEDDYRSGDVRDFYEKWNKLTKDNGIFESWVKPYCFESKSLTIDDLKPINQDDSSFIFNRFLEILRHNVVSDKGNAFNKIFTLFLCKVYDETTKIEGDGKELDFQWKEGIDNHISFQLRLTDLYKSGMEKFLSRTVSDFNEDDFKIRCSDLNEETKKYLLDEVNKLRLQKNNEFAIKEVYDAVSFEENAKVVKEVVELLQGYRIRYNKRQQYLSDFFELLLTTGLKQEAGQFFTPVPIAQFIIKSLPLEEIVNEKLKQKNGEILPFMIDYAAGSGHFVTEYMHEVQNIINKKDPNKYIPDTKKDLLFWQNAKYEWATDYVYGIEKDYRLVKVGKVGCYLHGDGLANVILSDGLGNFVKTKDYKGKLHKENDDNSKDNQQFDIILSNPPYSVSAFRQTTRDYYTENDFDLYDKLTDNSSEIECLFVERTKQLLKDGGVAGIILPSSILTNTGIYTKTRELLLKYFEIVGITELGSNTFMATGTNTVVLFLRRRNNYECINFEKAVDKFFMNHTDVTINGIETPVAKYVNYVWEDLSFEDYLTLLDQNPNENVKNHALYKEYKSKINVKTDKEFWNKVIVLEKEKIYFFILTYLQKLVIVKTGEKDAEKQFLGYEFSNRRGDEGIHPIQRSKTIDECTKLFDINSFDNPQKASTYILKAFENDFDFSIDETLKDNISKANLLDLMNFDRIDFDKNINVKVKKKIKIESKYPVIPLKNLENDGFVTFLRGQGLTKEDVADDGIYKCILYGELYTKYKKAIIDCVISHTNIKTNILSKKGDVLVPATTTADEYGIAIGRAISEDNIQIGGDINIIRTENKILNAKYLAELLCNTLKESLAQYATGTNILHLSNENIRNLKIPFPPLDIQQKIVDEIEKIEKLSNEYDKTLKVLQNRKMTIIENCFKNNQKNIFIKNIAEVKGGKRVPKGENTIKTKTKHPYIKVLTFTENGSIDTDKLEYITEDTYKKISNYTISCDDIFISIAGTIGLCGIIPKELNGANLTENAAKIIITDKNVEKRWLLNILQSQTIKKTYQNLTHGLGTPKLSLDRIRNIEIPAISLTEQQNIVSQIEEFEKQIAEAQSIIDNSKQAKKAILDKYLK